MKKSILFLLSGLLLCQIFAASAPLPTKWEEHWFGPAENPADNSYISLSKIPSAFTADLDSNKPSKLQLIVYKNGLISFRTDASFPLMVSKGSQDDLRCIKWVCSDKLGKEKHKSKLTAIQEVGEVVLDEDSSKIFLEYLKRGQVISCSLTGFKFSLGHKYGTLKFQIDSSGFPAFYEKTLAPYHQAAQQ